MARIVQVQLCLALAFLIQVIAAKFNYYWGATTFTVYHFYAFSFTVFGLLGTVTYSALTTRIRRY